MAHGMLKTVDPASFRRDEIAAAQDAVQALTRRGGEGGVRVEVAGGGETPSQTVVLPERAVRLLADILGFLADGRGVSIVPDDAALTTSQAADILDVSRPYLIRLLEQGKMPFSVVGSHRRVALRDVLAHKRATAAESRRAADYLVAQAQELDMGY